MSNQPHTRIQPLRRELPPRLLHAKQIAQGCEPCSVIMQQSPHRGLWQRAQGPAASAPQAQRAMPPPPPVGMSCPVTAQASRSARQRASLLLAGGALALVSCAGGAISFQGQGTIAVVRADQLEERAKAPERAHQLGTVEASCQRVDAASGFDATPWSDISCSPELLREAISRKAAAQGATALVNSQCEGVALTADTVQCSAEVWASDESPGESLSSSVEAHAVELAAAAERVERAWQVRVSSYLQGPSGPGKETASADGPSVPSRNVRELAIGGVQDSRLGDLTAFCGKGPCDEEDLRGGLRAAARRVGANTLVAVRCFQADLGLQCVASIARSAQ